jgi:hypothetical protein
VGLVGLKPQPTGYGPKLIINGLRGLFCSEAEHGRQPKMREKSFIILLSTASWTALPHLALRIASYPV